MANSSSSSPKGFGKRTRLSEYPIQGRGGQGVKTLQHHRPHRQRRRLPRCRARPGPDACYPRRHRRPHRVDSISLIVPTPRGVTVTKVKEGDQVASIAAFTMSDPVEDAMTDVSANANGAHDDDEQVLNETILELDEEE
ncbi:DNA gyrase C-terminal beta-propeller domain-containing protein [Candidatus Amarobacter glycogenicus]|uniref:DNA gyrase C-terminal beta-propeller domain-containing protein n=1 Tax=Candidatus Amarobacter glycogenicus TaxID=3140699 RepID=UPI002A101A12|nr:hypothetical protein [Dehalococcoidia bacterium]